MIDVAKNGSSKKEVTARRLITHLKRKDNTKRMKPRDDDDEGEKDEEEDAILDDDKCDTDSDDMEYSYDTDDEGNSDWEEFIKGHKDDCVDNHMYKTAGRMMRSKVLRAELSKKLLPVGRPPNWLKQLGGQLFLDLEKDESILKSLELFLTSDHDVECFDFNTLLFLRLNTLYDIRQALCAIAIFQNFVDNADSMLRQCVWNFVSKTKCALGHVTMAIWKLDVMIERLPIISKDEGVLHFRSDAVAYCDADYLQCKDTVACTVPVWVKQFDEWLLSVLSLSADNAASEYLSFNEKRKIHQWIKRMSDSTCRRDGTARKELDRWYARGRRYKKRRMQAMP